VRRYKDKGKSPLRMVGEAKAGVGVEMEGGREEESNMEGKNKTARVFVACLNEIC
jgi:hypothetical protein